MTLCADDRYCLFHLLNGWVCQCCLCLLWVVCHKHEMVASLDDEGGISSILSLYFMSIDVTKKLSRFIFSLKLIKIAYSLAGRILKRIGTLH
jgi:hypothetical protein